MTPGEIQELVLGAIRSLNMARTPETRLEATAGAPIFGPGSPLDSLGLVSLLIDIEDALRDQGIDINLSDSQAMSASHSPFRSVSTLAGYLHQRLASVP